MPDACVAAPRRLWATASLVLAAAGLLPPALAQPRYPWPVVTVPGSRPMAVPMGRGMVLRQTEARADRILIRLRGGPVSAAAALSPAMAAQAKADLEARLGVPVDRYWPECGMASVRVDAANTWQALADLRARADVAEAGPDIIVHPAYVPNTPEFQQQYHHLLIDTPDTWDVKNAADWRTVVVAMVDTGTDLSHPDLMTRIWTNAGEIPSNGKDDDRNGFVDDVHGWDFITNTPDPQPKPDGIDQNGDAVPDEQANHGTLTSGLAGAEVFDNWGCAGVYPNARIMPVKIFPEDGGTDLQTVVDGINYAAGNGAQVINLSIGASWTDMFTPPIVAAHSKGIVVVSAGGNSGTALTDTYWESPVCNDGNSPLTDNFVIGVGYTDRNEARGVYSNWDASSGKRFIDVSTAGDQIYGPALYRPSIPGFDKLFYTNTGSSFSAPQVSGAAAVIRAVYPSYTNDQILADIRAAADNINVFLGTAYSGKMGGRLYLPRAVGLNLPPRAVKNLAATDTPYDEGGSISLSWVKSFDDGSGGMRVQRYYVERRQGTTGTFAKVGEAAAGAESYTNTPTTDGLDYYYRIGAYDGSQTGYCDPVGPVQSRDDKPPPRITSLTARDRPGDHGGALDLDWSGYSPPADCAGYKVYRDGVTFSEVGARSPIATLTGAATKTCTDDHTTDFTDYYYAVVAYDKAGNADPVVSSVGPVQSISNSGMTLKAGLHLMSAPAVPYDGNPTSLLPSGATYKYARWDNAAGRYALYVPGGTLTALLRMALGRGFWLQLPAETSIVIGGQTASSGDFTMDLQPGWLLLGNPYFAEVDLTAAEVQVGSVVMNLRAAEEDGYLSSTAYVFDPTAYSYQMRSALWTGQGYVEPWSGFWMHVLKACQLILVRPASASAAGVQVAGVARAAAAGAAGVAASSVQPRLLWRMRLAARGSQGADLDNFIAASEDKVLPAAEPPAAPGAPRLFFRDGHEELAAVARQPGVRMTWSVVLQPAPGDTATRLAAEDVAGVPREYAIMLLDLTTGRTTDLRREAGVEVAGEAARQFQLTVTRQGSASLVVTAMSASRTGVGAQLVFTLSAPASCDVDLLNIAGRTVRRVRSNQAMAAGQQAVVWNGRNDAGSPLPSGTYLVRVVARGQDGAQVQALRSLVLQR